MALYIKDPNAVLDYKWDWSAWLDPTETITTSTWIVPSGLTKDDEDNDDTTATVWLSGGTVGADYPVVNRVTTSEGRTDDRTMQIAVRER